MYILDLHAITPQLTHDNSFDEGSWTVLQPTIFHAQEPAYQELIPLGQLRRMGKAVRMGIGTALPLLARNSKPDGIIFGTANGGLEDCIKFLNQIVEYEEGVLTPTNFVQSTPNALAGQVALLSENQGYNMTHVNGSLAFESAILDATLFFEENTHPKSLLLGAVEEVSNYNYNIDGLGGRIKEELMTNEVMIQSKTPGSYCGEGSVQFIVSNQPTNALAELIDVAQTSFLEKSELNAFLQAFLVKNKIETTEIDLVLIGKNGDSRTDDWYDQCLTNFPSTPFVHFKKAVGEFRTVSSFALFIATKILNGKCKQLIEGYKNDRIKTILIYNHFDAIRHSFMLVRK